MRKTILITAGPTREYLDPIRYITNESTGILGYEIAKVAKKAGCKVVLITGNPALPIVAGVDYRYIVSARDLVREMKACIDDTDVLFMTSAVCDFYPKKKYGQKMKREATGDFSVALKKNKDILKMMGRSQVKGSKVYVGFCIETQHVKENAQKKLRDKHLDFIVANHYVSENSPFGDNTVAPLVLSKEGDVMQFPHIKKNNFAKTILEMALKRLS